MDRYHPDPYYQSLFEQARIERNTHLHSVFSAGVRKLASLPSIAVHGIRRRFASRAAPFRSSASPGT
jgi:hypothetical protein